MGSGDAGATAPMTIFASIGMNGDWAGIGPVTSSTGSPYGRGMRGHGSALADTSPLEPGWTSDTAPPGSNGEVVTLVPTGGDFALRSWG